MLAHQHSMYAAELCGLSISWAYAGDILQEPDATVDSGLPGLPDQNRRE